MGVAAAQAWSLTLTSAVVLRSSGQTVVKVATISCAMTSMRIGKKLALESVGKIPQSLNRADRAEELA